MFGVEQLPIPYLLNQGLISSIFGTETLFEGLSIRPGEKTTEFLISQGFIKAANVNSPYPSHSQLIQFFEQKGFKYRKNDSGSSGFINEELGLGVMDAHPGNFILHQEGIKPFDIHFEIIRRDAIAAISRFLS